jgi:hypothetical protein
VVEFRDGTVILGNAEIVHPSLDLLGQLFQTVGHGHAPASPGESLYPPREFLTCPFGPPDARFLEGKS